MNLPDSIATAAAVRSGSVSPREVVKAAIARIQKHDPHLNALVAERFATTMGHSGPVAGFDG